MTITADDIYTFHGYFGQLRSEFVQSQGIRPGKPESSNKKYYVVSALDSFENVIYQNYFDAEMIECGPEVGKSSDCLNKYFDISIPAISGIRKIIGNAAGSSDVLFQYEFTGIAPTIQILQQPPENSSQNFQISWKTHDPDSDVIYSSIFYSNDDGNPGTWINVFADGYETNSSSEIGNFTIKSEDLAGSISQSRIRVIAFDGVNSSDVISAPFHVGFRSPYLDNMKPEPGQIWEKGNAYLFKVSIYPDEYYEKIASEDIAWSSSRDGIFGHGQKFSHAGLSAGTHAITVTVNTPGGTATKTVENIVVAEKRPEIIFTVGDGIKPDLACNELRIDIEPGDLALQEVTWNNVGGHMVIVPLDQLPIRHLLKDKSSYIDVFATTKLNNFGSRKEAFIPLITCPPPIPPAGG